MLKRLNIIYGILAGCLAVTLLVLGFVFGWKTSEAFVSTLGLLLLAHPLLYLIMMIVKEAKISEYQTPKFVPICMLITILGGCAIWYLFFHLEFDFDFWVGLWYGCVLLVFSLPMLIGYLVNRFHSPKNSEGPKIIRRR